MAIKTNKHKKALLKLPNPICGICLKPIEHPDKATVDHKIPLSVDMTLIQLFGLLDLEDDVRITINDLSSLARRFQHE